MNGWWWVLIFALGYLPFRWIVSSLVPRDLSTASIVINALPDFVLAALCIGGYYLTRKRNAEKPEAGKAAHLEKSTQVPSGCVDQTDGQLKVRPRQLETEITNSVQSSAKATIAIEWYAIHAGREIGPFSPGELREQVVMGKVKADDLVRQTGGLWTKACEVDFLGHEFRLMESREAPAIRPDGFRVTWYSSQGLVIASVVAVMVVMSTGLWAYKHFTPQGQDIGRNLDRAVELPPRQDPEQNDANFYSARASNWSSKKNHAAARKDYDEAIRLDPGNANLYALRADTCLAMGEFDAAIKDFDVAIGMQPNALSYSGRAHAWRGKKNYELAIKDIDVALRHVAPDSFWAKWFKKDRDEMRNIVIISKVQEFVDAHPQIEEMSQFGSLGNSRWERATRPFRVGKTLTRIQQEELLDFLGIVAKYERHKSDPSFAEVVRELKDLTFPNP